MSYKWAHIVNSILCMASLLSIIILNIIHVLHVSVVHVFLLLNSIPMYIDVSCFVLFKNKIQLTKFEDLIGFIE